MANFVRWIQNAVERAVDPEKQSRRLTLARLLEGTLAKERNSFSMARFIEVVDHTPRDLEAAKQMFFRKLVERAWEDGKISDAEKTALKSYAERIELDSKAMSSIYNEIASDRFATSLARALEDGVLDAKEIQSLESIAGSVGLSLQGFVRGYFATEGEKFLAGMFAACTEEGSLSERAWKRLLVTSAQLGFNRNEVASLIQPQAKRFIEHILADAKSDGLLSESEDATLLMLLKQLGMSPDYCQYVESQIGALRVIRRASQGQLATLPHPSGVALRAGELVYFHQRAQWPLTKELKSGPVREIHQGALTITDYRLLFSSQTKSLEARLGKIIGHWGRTGVICVQITGKPEAQFRCEEKDPVLYAILEAAISMANQTRVAKSTEGPSRHIPREIRQRIWQRYGGQCSECGDKQYLEFDHIIPVAKGGSNSEANVQLLCRNCNQKKSDRI